MFLIAFGLSHLAFNSLNQNQLHNFVMEHHYFWLCIRAGIVLSFVIVWPYIVHYWARKYRWEDEYTKGIIRRRWRYAIWLIIIDLTFQLL